MKKQSDNPNKPHDSSTPALSDHFEVVGIVPGVVVLHGWGAVDFSTISLEQAKALHEQGCRYLKKK